MVRFPKGDREWEGFPALSEPLQLMGMDRKIFILLGVLSYALYTAVSLFFALIVFFVAFVVLRAASQADPHMLGILSVAAKYTHSWYDYDSAPSPEGFGPVVRSAAAVEPGDGEAV